MLPTGPSFNATWFIEQNLVPLLCLMHSSRMAHGPDPTQRTLVVQIDTASAHNARVTQNFFEHKPLERLPHPPDSPDIFPSDFDLFKKVKNALIGQEISDGMDLLEVVTEILSAICHDELQAVFRSWIGLSGCTP
jgi:hypothetical protein